MTAEQLNFEAALRERLAGRASTLIDGNERVLALLRQAREHIMEQLAAQPSDWRQWHLQRLRDQIDLILQAAGQQAATVVDGLLRELWQQGEDLVDKPLMAAGYGVEAALGAMDVRVLSAMRNFAAERMANVTAEAAARIGQQIGLVTIGGVTPWDATRAVQRILGESAPRRAATIVNTEAHRAYTMAGLQRIRESARLVPGLGKKWRRSGKLESRWQHDLIDGQFLPVDEPFKVPNPGGGVDLMLCPHDPSAPPEQVINCGCLLLPAKQGWRVMHPGAKPFTEREVKHSPGKETLDRKAKAAGLRPEWLPNPKRAVISREKLTAYALNPDHPVGGNKARVIASALGYTQDNADAMMEAIRNAIASKSQASKTVVTQHGTKYTVDLEMTGPKGSGTLRTAWIVDIDSDAPRLVTLYMK